MRRGVTRPDWIAAEGGSNGGLLIANMLSWHPERLGARFCTILADRHGEHEDLWGLQAAAC